MPEKPEGSRRPFATGSKPGPDAIDHYLEEKGFYRKHIARDASSLFRVVADQVFDIQNYHNKVRQDCAAFMEARPKEYSNAVDKNYFNYVSQLRRLRTHGSLLELRVLARMYRKNIILFEPNSNLQTNCTLYVQDDDYDASNPLRVFYSPKDKHFDVIYTMDYVERLAECQSVVYNVLYSNVFKLPDVQYAVERMLHDQEEKVTLPLENDPDQYVIHSGEVSSFDSHIDSNCVLKDPKTCHFHNQDDFEKIVEEHKDAITIINRVDDQGRIKIFKPIDGFLHDKSKSCVRQLLDEGITPFPYKVAKALDASIYRNTEFELWSENRKEQRLKWLDSADFPMKQQMDDKNAFYRNRRNGMFDKFYNDKYEDQMIVDEDRYMALDDEEKKKYVILDHHPLESYKLHELTNFDQFVPSKESLELTVMPVNVNYRGGFRNKRGGGRHFNNSNPHNYNNNYHNQNQHPFSNVESPNQQQMPYAADVERKPSYNQGAQDQHCYYQQHVQEPVEEHHQQQNVPVTPMYSAAPPQQSWSNPINPYMQPQQHMIHYAPMNYQQVMPFGNFTIPPPTYHTGRPYEGLPGDIMNLIKESDLSSNTINWNSKVSVSHDGGDLPYNDVPSLQFFYNLGVRYHLASGVQHRVDSVDTQIGKLDLNEGPSQAAGTAENLNEQNPNKSEAPPVPTNTPVSTKIGVSHGPPGNRHHADRNTFNRRPFSNRDNNEGSYRSNWSNHARKEIKFNSNVKNLHKNESKMANAGHSSKAPIQTQTFHSSGNAHANTNVSNQDKTSPSSSTTSYGQPTSPVLQEVTYQSSLPPFYHPQQTMMAPQQQQGVAMIVQVNEDGSYYQPMPAPGISYGHPYPYQGQPQQVFYQMPQPIMDASVLSSNDSGILEGGVYHGYQQPPVQYYPQYSAPPMPAVYYAPSLPPTPQIAHVAPVFPAPSTLQTIVSVSSGATATQTSTSVSDDRETVKEVVSDVPSK